MLSSFLKSFSLLNVSNPASPKKNKQTKKETKIFSLRNFLYHFLKCVDQLLISSLTFIWNGFILRLLLQYIDTYFGYRIFGWVFQSQSFKMLFHFLLTTMISGVKPVVIWVIVSLYVIYWFSEAAFNNFIFDF